MNLIKIAQKFLLSPSKTSSFLFSPQKNGILQKNQLPQHNNINNFFSFSLKSFHTPHPKSIHNFSNVSSTTSSEALSSMTKSALTQQNSSIFRTGPTETQQYFNMFFQNRGMKYNSAVKKRCPACQLVRRGKKINIICKANPRHKQKQTQKTFVKQRKNWVI